MRPPLSHTLPSLARRSALLLLLVGYTVFAAGPFFWAAMMSLRTTSEISRSPFGWPSPAHWEKFGQAWFNSNYSVYFSNSLVVVSTAVLAVTLIGAMTAHALARYRFRGNRTL
jgi:ABC-type glycerol-3-phosphate transport system permease component